MGIAKISTKERNGKLSISVAPPDGEQSDNRPWNIWDVSYKPTMEEVLQVASHAYELGRKHQTMDTIRHLYSQNIQMEIVKD